MKTTKKSISIIIVRKKYADKKSVPINKILAAIFILLFEKWINLF